MTTSLLHSIEPDSLRPRTDLPYPRAASGGDRNLPSGVIRRMALDLLDLADRLDSLAPSADRLPRPTDGTVPMIVDADGFRAWVGDRRLELTHQEFRLLQELVAHPGSVLTRRQLMQLAWDDPVGSGRTVDVHVRRVRVALGPAAGRITTVRNVGYRFD